MCREFGFILEAGAEYKTQSIVQCNVREFSQNIEVPEELKDQKIIDDKILSRKRRGWMNFLGTGLHAATGVMDHNDAKKIRNQMIQLNNTYLHTAQLLANQTTIQDLTHNILKRDEAAVYKQMTEFHNELKTAENMTLIRELFDAVSIQTMAMIETYRERTASIIQIHGRKVASSLFTPGQLRENLKIINENMNKNLILPSINSPLELAQFYELLEPKISINEKDIVIKITVPLLQIN